MEGQIIDIELWRLTAAYLFVLIVMIIVKVRKISREKQIIIATFRMTLQLVLAGYLLTYIFENPHPLLTIIYVGIIVCFSIFNIFKMSKVPLSLKLKKVIVLSMVSGPIFCLLYYSVIVIHFQPWYDPRYFIPISGMIIGNAMTALNLGLNHLMERLIADKEKVESALMLGATPAQAVKKYVDAAFDASILPTINSMLGMGIIFLPGMMTGQILAGISPLVAIEYQLVILLGILGSVSITVIIFILFGYKTLFTKRSQINF